MHSLKTIVMMIVLCTLVQCRGNVFSDESIFAPWPYGLPKSAPEGSPPDYAKGWDDGCKTGIGTMNRQIYKSFYGYKQDPAMAGNPNYYKAWKDAYTYCRQYSFRFTWDALDARKKAGPMSMGPLCILCPNEIR